MSDFHYILLGTVMIGNTSLSFVCYKPPPVANAIFLEINFFGVNFQHHNLK